MEIEQRDLDKLRDLLQQMYDTADWKVGTDTLADFVHPKLDKCLQILDSYLSSDVEMTTGDLFERSFTELEDEFSDYEKDY